VLQEKEIPLSITLVNLQGKQDCKFTIGYNFSTQPKRAKFAEGWPSSVEENLERLADAGEAMDQLATLCRNCKGMIASPFPCICRPSILTPLQS